MGDFFDTVKNLKHAGPSPRICPACGGMKIKHQGSLSGWLLPPVYACEECGYVGQLILELDESEESEKA